MNGLDAYPIKKLEYEQMESIGKSLFNGALGKMKAKEYAKFKIALFSAVLFPFIFCSQARVYGFTVYYLYKLANFSGGIPYGFGTQLALDQNTGEVYVLDPSRGGVNIFNTHGMETYKFGDDTNLGTITSLAVDKKGNMFILSYVGGYYSLDFCNYRGELEHTIKLSGLPWSSAQFKPNTVILVGGRLYLVDMVDLYVAQIDKNGACLKTWDLNKICGWDKMKGFAPGSVSAFGFAIDREGNMYFTVPTSFRAYKVTPDGKVYGFGHGGDGPGAFGVVSGIAVDDKGYIYVADRLRCVILIFRKNLQFLREFGNRSYAAGGLIVPTDLVVARDGTLYVSEGGNSGVDVFRMGYD